MDPLSALLGGGAVRVIKSLVAGTPLTRGDLGEVCAAVFEAVTDLRDENAAALVRIEAKLDASLEQDFSRAFDLGLYRLRDASSPDLPLSAQLEALQAARQSFLEAAAGSVRVGQKVQALSSAASCSLLLGRPNTAHQELNEAWQKAYANILSISRKWANPLGAAQGSLSGLFGSDKRVMEVRADAEVEFNLMRTPINDVQHARLQLGTPVEKAPSLQFAGSMSRAWPRFARFQSASASAVFPDGIKIAVTTHVQPQHDRRGAGSMSGRLEIVWPTEPSAWISVGPAITDPLGDWRPTSTTPITTARSNQASVLFDASYERVGFVQVEARDDLNEPAFFLTRFPLEVL